MSDSDSLQQQKGFLSGPSHSSNPYDPRAPQNNGFPHPPYHQPMAGQPHEGQPYYGQPYQQQWHPKTESIPTPTSTVSRPTSTAMGTWISISPESQWISAAKLSASAPSRPVRTTSALWVSSTAATSIPPESGTSNPELSFRQCGPRLFTMVDTNNRVLYSFNFKDSGRGNLHVSRGENGPPCGSAQFHSLSSKVDMSIGSAYVNFKKEFPSSTGQGFLVWRKDSESFWLAKGNLVLESQRSRIATFRLDKGPDDSGRQGGGMEIHRPGLSQSQMDEIVASGVVELEKRRISAASSSSGSSAGFIVAVT